MRLWRCVRERRKRTDRRAHTAAEHTAPDRGPTVTQRHPAATTDRTRWDGQPGRAGRARGTARGPWRAQCGARRTRPRRRPRRAG
eukprot:7073235-Prorocentrum_lima.AAC.1